MKKIICIGMAMLILCCMGTTVSATGELRDAKTYQLGSTAKGQITENDDKDVYSFNLESAGRIDINYIAQIERSALKLYDADGKEIWHDNPGWNSTVQQISYQVKLDLTKGKYFFSISKYYNYGNYELTIQFEDARESFTEAQNGSNNVIRDSNTTVRTGAYRGQIALNDEVDIYNLTLNESSKLDISFLAQIERVALKLYDEAGKEIWHDNPGWNSTVQQISYQAEFYLTKGRYYFSVSKYYNYGNYNFTIDYKSANESFTEIQNGSDNTVLEANSIVINQIYNGQIALNDEVDTYKITLPGGKIKLHYSAQIERSALKIYDSTGKEIWHDNPGWNSTTKQIAYETDVDLSAGIYYLSISKYYNYGNYTFYFTDGGNVKQAAGGNAGISVLLNGMPLTFDQPPVIQNGRTLVPVRAIFEALGASVEWDQTTQTVTSQKDGTTIVMSIGSNVMYRNGTAVMLDVSPQILNSRTLVPVRAIAEAYGCNVEWEQQTQTVIIN